MFNLSMFRRLELELALEFFDQYMFEQQGHK